MFAQGKAIEEMFRHYRDLVAPGIQACVDVVNELAAQAQSQTLGMTQQQLQVCSLVESV